MVVDLGLHMDDGPHIITQSCHCCQLRCSSKYGVFRRIEPEIAFVRYEIMIFLRLSRERDEASTEAEAMGSGPTGPCLKSFLPVEVVANVWFRKLWPILSYCAMDGVVVLNLDNHVSMTTCTLKILRGLVFGYHPDNLCYRENPDEPDVTRKIKRPTATILRPY
ncbi:hypothetical protein TNCV_2284121 [Trichonephila clavipes]|nr:hypothetical protein TNCV_2284121 [Trichonephila clavipes]